MSEELKHKIYTTTECISEQTMFDYIDNKLNAKEQHHVEKHLLSCDLCSDALDGLGTLKNRGRINTINQKISERLISNPGKENKIVFFNFKTITSIAAAVALLIGAVFLFNQFAFKESDVAELKEESAPPPPVTISNTESVAASDSVNLKEPESITSKNTTIQFESSGKSQQQFALTEEQTANSYYNNSVSSAEGAKGSSVVTTGDLITKSDAKNELLIPTESSIPKAGLLEKEKELALDETKKAEEKNENTTITTLAQTTTAPQKNDVSYSVTDKKAEKISKNNRYENDRKGKDKVAKESADEDVAGNVTYAPQSVIADQENLKTEKPKAETNQIANADSIYIFRDGEPQYPGGNDALMAFIRKNFDVSGNTLNWNSTMGTKIIVEFTIDTKGNILDPTIKQGINKELNEKAIEMIKKMPKWIPVSTPYKYVLPIRLEFK